ncbi:hypothetical protein WEH80_10600 [Actinomycetes bacterium KLBMP 9759]
MAEAEDRERLRETTATSDIASFGVREDVVAQLRGWPPGPLVDLAVDEAEPWWRRRCCVEALAGRVPPERAGELLACAFDEEATTEVRGALLDVLSVPGAPHEGVLLDWLQAQPLDGQPYDMDLAILRARGALADLDAAGVLADLVADPWPHRAQVGRDGLDLLVDRHGPHAVVARLGARTAAQLLTGGSTMGRRLAAQRLVDDVTPALGDPSRPVARAAYEQLATTGDHHAELQRLAECGGRGAAQHWALAVLAARGTDIRAAWETLGRPRVELPGVPDDVRSAILHTYGPGQPETDPLWLVEQACTEPAGPVDVAELLDHAVAALANAALLPREPVSAGDWNDTGWGTYHVISTAVGDVVVSTLGPYVSAGHDVDDESVRPAVDALVAVGFQEVDETLAATRFDGLAVYFFGDRQSLRVYDLLFFCQD